ncbi:CPBP family intramembrane metalloprotease [Paenibacillus sp. GSMTC-2017]|uniref:CPBP family intramembrane glutamic endopeptidase n=1 Tax=Paenibacillus sp. GSMTC-2017 TaxID=2794350 RepID=UPI0018D95390|nr:CPBP family intramembrane glutamic endopeptidase [Paenibacillus sp. GSMTC-2017]MBH5318585.1 CPBP family intramembrane metalloprotease [Paenibacillus sp. GSMTC-2017]
MQKSSTVKKIIFMFGNIAIYLGVFYAFLYLLRSTYNYEFTADFAKFLDINPAMFMAVLFTAILLVYMVVFRVKRMLWPEQKQTLFQASGFRRIELRDASLMLAMGLAGCLFSICLIEINVIARHFPSIPYLVDDLIRGDSILYVILGAGLIAPIFEEILFRGLIYGQLRSVMPVFGALLLQTLLYAYFQPSLSLSFIGFGSGLIYAILYIRIGTIWAPIIVQTTAMSLIFILKDAGFYEVMDGLGEPVLYILAVLSLFFLLGATFVVWRRGTPEIGHDIQRKPNAELKGI